MLLHFIDCGEFFLFVRVYDTLLNAYSGTVFHTSFPQTYVLVYFLYHFLLVEGSHSIYIILLTVIFFLGIYCFGLKGFVMIGLIFGETNM